MKRRTFVTLSLFLLSVPRAALGGIPRSEDREQQTLVACLKTLFPHRPLSKKEYLSASETFIERADSIVSALYPVLPHNFFELTDASRSAALQKLADSNEFQVFQNTAAVIFYSHPPISLALGHEGPSLSRGGYAGPDFGRVDWLEMKVD